MSIDPASFIRDNLQIVEPAFAPGIRLYQAHPGSGLRRLIGEDGPAPYWAYTWAGGAALVRHMLAAPGIVKGRRVLDLGAGSGIVGIVAARHGAHEVIAAEIDPHGAVAIGLNAALNGAEVRVEPRDLLDGEPPYVDLVLVGDLYYAADLAARVTPFLRRCLAAGIEVLVGDPGRDTLSRDVLEPIAHYAVSDFGEGSASEASLGSVYILRIDTPTPEDDQ